MSRYIDADLLIAELKKDEERFDKEADDCRKNARNYTDCYMQAMSSRADGIRDAIVEVYDAPSINLADYVPREFHDKTCEAMAKAHQEEIANMVRVVRCKECYMCDEEMWCSFYDSIMESDDYCSYGEREGE